MKSKSILEMFSIQKLIKKIKFLSKPNNSKKVLFLLGFLIVLFFIYKYYLKEGFENSPEDLEEKISGNKSAVLFYADWCGHCKKIKPVWDELKRKIDLDNNNIKLMKVECGKPTEKKEHADIMKKYDIKGYPTIITFKDGVGTEYTGNRDKDSMYEIFTKL
mgnify:CR=1 FL=1